MSERFVVNQNLIFQARNTLGNRKRLYWIIGGSCTGKSTVAREIGDRANLTIVNMDDYIFDQFLPFYRSDRHPASHTWFGAQNPLDWALSLTWDEFNAMNRATNAEFLDLLVDELEKRVETRLLLIEGGFTHPSVLVQVGLPAQVVCLKASDEIRHKTWHTGEDRIRMKQWVLDLPDGRAKWRKFLYFDKMMAQEMVDESKAVGVQTIERLEGMSIREMSGLVIEALGLDSN